MVVLVVAAGYVAVTVVVFVVVVVVVVVAVFVVGGGGAVVVGVVIVLAAAIVVEVVTVIFVGVVGAAGGGSGWSSSSCSSKSGSISCGVDIVVNCGSCCGGCACDHDGSCDGIDVGDFGDHCGYQDRVRDDADWTSCGEDNKVNGRSGVNCGKRGRNGGAG